MSQGLKAFEKWLRSGGATGRGLGEETISTYLKVAKLIVKAKSPSHIVRPELSLSTKQKYVAVLRQWAAFTKDADLADKVKLGPRLRQLMSTRSSRTPDKIEAFSDEEVKRFLDALDQYFKDRKPYWIWPAVSLQIHLGLRVGADLAGLRYDAVKKAIRSGKLTVVGKRERVDELPAGFVKEELKMLAEIPDWETVADLISPETRKEPEHIHRQQAYQIYRRILLIIDVKARIGASRTHRFRHWAITRFIRDVAKGDYKRAQRFARHANLETTLRYYRTVDLDEDDAMLAKLKRER